MDLEAFVALKVEEAEGRGGSRISDVLDSTDDVGSTDVSDVLSPERSLGLRLKPQVANYDEDPREGIDRAFQPDITGDSSISQHSIAELAQNLSFSALHNAISELSGDDSNSPQKPSLTQHPIIQESPFSQTKENMSLSQHPMHHESTLSNTRDLSQHPYDMSRGDQSAGYSVLSQHRLSEMHTALDPLMEASAELDRLASENPDQLDDVLEVELSKPKLLMPMEFSMGSTVDSGRSSAETSANGTRPQTVVDCEVAQKDASSKRSSLAEDVPSKRSFAGDESSKRSSFGDESSKRSSIGGESSKRSSLGGEFSRGSENNSDGYKRKSLLDFEDQERRMLDGDNNLTSNIRESEIYLPGNATIGDTLLESGKQPVSQSTPNRHSDGYDLTTEKVTAAGERPLSAPFGITKVDDVMETDPDVKTIMSTVGIDDYMSENERSRVLESINSTPARKEIRQPSEFPHARNEEASVFRLQSYETHGNLAQLSKPPIPSQVSNEGQGQMLHDLDPVHKTSYWVATSPIIGEERLSPRSSLGCDSLPSRHSLEGEPQNTQRQTEERLQQPYFVRENASLELFTKRVSKNSESHPSSRGSTDNMYQRSGTDSLLRYDRGERLSIGSDSSKPEEKQADISIPSLSSASSRVSTDRLSELAHEQKKKELAAEFERIEKQGLDVSSNSKSSARSRDSNEYSSLTNVTKPDSQRSSMECFYMSSPFGGENIKEMDADQEQHGEVEQAPPSFAHQPEVINDVHSIHERTQSNRSSMESISSSKHEQTTNTRLSIESTGLNNHEKDQQSARSSIGSTSSKHSVRILENPERISLPFDTYDEDGDTPSRRKSLSERVSDILASAPAQDVESLGSPRAEGQLVEQTTPDRGSMVSEEDDIERVTGEYKAILKGATAGLTGEATTADIHQEPSDVRQIMIEIDTPDSNIDEQNNEHQPKRQPVYDIDTSDTEDGLDKDVRRILAKYGRRLSESESENQSRASPVGSTYETDDTLSGRVQKLLKKADDLGDTQKTLENVPTYLFDDPSKSMTLPDLGSTVGSEDSLQVIIKNKAKEKVEVKQKKTPVSKESDPLHTRVKQILAVTNYLEEGGSSGSSRTPSRTSSVDYEMLEKDLNEIQLNLEYIKEGSNKSNSSSNRSGEERADEERQPVSPLLTRGVVPVDVALDIMHGPEVDTLEKRTSYSSPDLRSHDYVDDNTSDDQRRIEARIYGYYEKLKEEKRRETIEEEKRRQILMAEKRREILREEKRKEELREEQRQQDFRRQMRRPPIDVNSIEQHSRKDNLRAEMNDIPQRATQKPPIPQDDRRTQMIQNDPVLTRNTRPSPSRLRPTMSHESYDLHDPEHYKRLDQYPDYNDPGMQAKYHRSPGLSSIRSEPHVSSFVDDPREQFDDVKVKETLDQDAGDLDTSEDSYLAQKYGLVKKDKLVSSQSPVPGYPERVANIVERHSPTRQAYDFLDESNKSKLSINIADKPESLDNNYKYSSPPKDTAITLEGSRDGYKDDSVLQPGTPGYSFSLSPYQHKPFSVFGDVKNFVSGQLGKANSSEFNQSVELRSPLKKHLNAEQNKKTKEAEDVVSNKFKEFLDEEKEYKERLSQESGEASSEEVTPRTDDIDLLKYRDELREIELKEREAEIKERREAEIRELRDAELRELRDAELKKLRDAELKKQRHDELKKLGDADVKEVREKYRESSESYDKRISGTTSITGTRNLPIKSPEYTRSAPDLKDSSIRSQNYSSSAPELTSSSASRPLPLTTLSPRDRVSNIPIRTSPSNLRPYKPAGSNELYYVEGLDDCNQSVVSTVESTHIGSDDAKGPLLPPSAYGSRHDSPRGVTGVYSKSSTQGLGTIQEHSMHGSRDNLTEVGRKSDSNSDSQKSRHDEDRERSFTKAHDWVHGNFPPDDSRRKSAATGNFPSDDNRRKSPATVSGNRDSVDSLGSLPKPLEGSKYDDKNRSKYDDLLFGTPKKSKNSPDRVDPRKYENYKENTAPPDVRTKHTADDTGARGNAQSPIRDVFDEYPRDQRYSDSSINRTSRYSTSTKQDDLLGSINAQDMSATEKRMRDVYGSSMRDETRLGYNTYDDSTKHRYSNSESEVYKTKESIDFNKYKISTNTTRDSAGHKEYDPRSSTYSDLGQTSKSIPELSMSAQRLSEELGSKTTEELQELVQRATRASGFDPKSTKTSAIGANSTGYFSELGRETGQYSASYPVGRDDLYRRDTFSPLEPDQDDIYHRELGSKHGQYSNREVIQDVYEPQGYTATAESSANTSDLLKPSSGKSPNRSLNDTSRSFDSRSRSPYSTRSPDKMYSSYSSNNRTLDRSKSPMMTPVTNFDTNDSESDGVCQYDEYQPKPPTGRFVRDGAESPERQLAEILSNRPKRMSSQHRRSPIRHQQHVNNRDLSKGDSIEEREWKLKQYLDSENPNNLGDLWDRFNTMMNRRADDSTASDISSASLEKLKTLIRNPTREYDSIGRTRDTSRLLEDSRGSRKNVTIDESANGYDSYREPQDGGGSGDDVIDRKANGRRENGATNSARMGQKYGGERRALGGSGGGGGPGGDGSSEDERGNNDRRIPQDGMSGKKNKDKKRKSDDTAEKNGENGEPKRKAWIIQDETLGSIPEDQTIDSVSSDFGTSSEMDSEGKLITKTTKRHLPADPKLLKLQQKIAKQKEKYIREHVREKKRKEKIALLEKQLIEQGGERKSHLRRRHMTPAETSSDSSNLQTTSTPSSTRSSMEKSDTSATLTVSDITTSTLTGDSTLLETTENTTSRTLGDTFEDSTMCECRQAQYPRSKSPNLTENKVRNKRDKSPEKGERVQVKARDKSPHKSRASRSKDEVERPPMVLKEVDYFDNKPENIAKDKPLKQKPGFKGSYMEFDKPDSDRVPKTKQRSSSRKRSTSREKRTSSKENKPVFTKSSKSTDTNTLQDDVKEKSKPKSKSEKLITSLYDHMQHQQANATPKVPHTRDFGATCPTPVNEGVKVSACVQTETPCVDREKETQTREVELWANTLRKSEQGMFTPETSQRENNENNNSRRQPKIKFNAGQSGFSWFLPISDPKPWRKPLAERQAYATSLENKRPISPVGLVLGGSLRSNPDRDDPVVVEKLSLQDAFLHRNQNFISKSRERQRHVALRAEERKMENLHEMERDRLFDVKKKMEANLEALPICEQHYNPQKRVLTKKEMKEHSRKMYQSLPEVQDKIMRKKREEAYKTNRLKAQIYKQRVLNKVLHKQGPWLRT